MGQGETVSGFSVGFGRLAGRGEPGWQLYEIIDGVTFETIESSWTRVEPGTSVLFGLRGLILVRRRR